MTPAMRDCASQIRSCWIMCDSAMQAGDVNGANRAFSQVFDLVDTFPVVEDDDVKALAFLCILTWVKVALALEAAGQSDPALEAQQQVFSLLDGYWALDHAGAAVAGANLDTFAGLESEESAELVGRLYLLCNQHGRKDALYWGRCFMDLDQKSRGNEKLN